MKKFLILILAFLLLLTACAAEKPADPTQAPAKAASAIADTSMATPQVGSATVLERAGISVIPLYSKPDTNSPLSGQVHPGEQGKFLGADRTGRWVLVQINDQTGWALFQLFSLTTLE